MKCISHSQATVHSRYSRDLGPGLVPVSVFGGDASLQAVDQELGRVVAVRPADRLVRGAAGLEH